jgi:hypothetical protein
VVNREELAWAAGLFDGEGYVGVRPVQGTARLFLQVQMTQVDRRVLDRFQSAVMGLGKVYGPYPRGGNSKPQFRFMTGKFEHSQAIMAMLWNWLSPVKREQFRIAQESFLASQQEAAA